jgi:hypothetical protein
MMERPAPLPFCAYPVAADSDRHGLQPLPDKLPLLDLTAAASHRSVQYRVTPAADLTPAQLVDMARVIGYSFAKREVMSRHLQPAAEPPPDLLNAIHRDPLGTSTFGSWDRSQLLYWFVRLLGLTDPTSPRSSINRNEDVITQSVVVTDPDGQVIGGAVNETLPPPDAEFRVREGDPFLDAALGFVAPIMDLLGTQDVAALAALARHYPQFADAVAGGQVGHHFMVARSDALPKDDTFELVAATMERYRDHGFRYVVVEATKQWTGAACEVLGGVRVHFAPFRAKPTVPAAPSSNEGAPSSPDGFLSDKDSGSMFYVLRLG